MTPFRSKKNTNWEGAFRIPLLVRWPGQIKAGTVSNGIVQHHDWLPYLTRKEKDKAASFTIDDALAKMTASSTGD